MKTILTLIELYVLLRIIWKAARFFMGTKRGKQGKGIMGKISTLVSRGLHHRLDKAIRKQSEVQGYGKNVTDFKKYKRKVN